MPQSFKDDTIHDLPLAASGTRQAADPADAVATGPRQVLAGRYELLGLVGIGGMGSVYRARDLELEELVAVKVLRRELSVAPEVTDRFRREVRLSRKVTHARDLDELLFALIVLGDDRVVERVHLA